MSSICAEAAIRISSTIDAFGIVRSLTGAWGPRLPTWPMIQPAHAGPQIARSKEELCRLSTLAGEIS